MSAPEMRKKLLDRYPGSKTWAARVSRMTDNQVYAIYMRIYARN